jgi:ATP-binding cassette subfamily B (MDR/TAP) protein 1
MEPDSSLSEPQESAETDYSSKAEEKATFGHYVRIFSYTTTLDRLMLTAAVTTAAGSGVTLPLLNIVFGRLVGHFNDFFIPGSGVTKQQFLKVVNQNALYIVYLFIGKFVLSYISMVSNSL